jgi:acetyl-CoA carboxylase biotin carboxyl carrier protein
LFKLNEIKELMKLMDQTSLQELEIENERTRLFIRKGNKTESVFVTAPAMPTHIQQAVPQQAIQTSPVVEEQAPIAASKPVKDTAGLHTIVSPMVGTFYQSSAPGAAPFVSVGSRVNEKTICCIVEAMKLMNEIEAEIKGEIVEILVDNGQLVEYGQPLFLVKPE